MDISRQFINNPVRVWLTILLLGIGGIFALLNIGRLEDPAFTIKTAVVITHYPGASAQQVEEEVTLPLENALQQLPYLDNVSSISSNGLSQITVNIASNYHSNELPQIWDELRRRVGDAARLFPPGVVSPSSTMISATCLASSLPFPATVLAIRSWSAMPSSCVGSWCWCPASARSPSAARSPSKLTLISRCLKWRPAALPLINFPLFSVV